MRKISKSAIVAIILAVALVGVSVYATIQTFKTITTSVHVAGIYEIEVYEEDHTTVCTSIDWGTLAEGASVSYMMWIDNEATGTAGQTVYIGWTKTGFPASGFDLTAEYEAGTWQSWTENVYNIGTMELDPGEFVKVRFTLENTGADMGDFSFNIIFNAADSNTG